MGVSRVWCILFIFTVLLMFSGLKNPQSRLITSTAPGSGSEPAPKRPRHEGLSSVASEVLEQQKVLEQGDEGLMEWEDAEPGSHAMPADLPAASPLPSTVTDAPTPDMGDLDWEDIL